MSLFFLEFPCCTNSLVANRPRKPGENKLLLPDNKSKKFARDENQETP